MTPEQFRIDEVVSFLARWCGERAHVLEVGCGRGAVAAALAARGHEVVALDRELRDLVDAPGVRFVERDFLAYEDDAPFDVVAFTASLHHISPLDGAIETAHRLLKPRGALVVDDFDLEAPDETALRWYYETQEQLVADGLVHHDHVDHHGDLRARWRHAHEHHDEPPLHTGAAMREAIEARMNIETIERPPYLYRYIAGGLPADDKGGLLAAQLFAVEQRLVVPVGLRIVARR